jgi:hypothetical protein
MSPTVVGVSSCVETAMRAGVKTLVVAAVEAVAGTGALTGMESAAVGGVNASASMTAESTMAAC